MNEQKYNQWWQLHLRVSRGETLNPHEQTLYNVGLDILDNEEKEQFQSDGLSVLHQLRANIVELRHLHAELVRESSHLDDQISTPEKDYQHLTGYQLAV